MKRRTRTQPTNAFYSNEPAVARGLIAGKPPVQNASLGNSAPKMVAKHPGKMSGIAGFQDKHRPKAKGAQPVPQVHPLKSGTARPSNIPRQGGYHKLSGHPGAHFLGKKKK